MRRLVLVVVACSSSPAPKPVANRAAPPPKPACTDARVAAIAAHLRDRWHVDTLDVRCTPGTFPGPGYFVTARAAAIERAGIVAADGETELVRFVPEIRSVVTSVIDYATADLDGDGIDEIVETWRRTAPGMLGTANRLVIRRIANRGFTRILGPHLSVTHPELGGCRAELRLAGRTLVIKVEHLSRIPPSDCLAQGTHTFALRAGRVIETRRRR